MGNDKRIEELIKTEYVLPEDYEKIAKCAKNNNLGVSFRINKPEALAMLARGAGTKPHTILEKSLSRKGLKEKGYDLISRELEPFLGLVPCWTVQETEDKRACPTRGLYVTETGKEFFDRDRKFETMDSDKGKGTIVRVKDWEGLAALKDKLDDGTLEGDWAKFFITGDYDMHDLVSYIAQRGPIPSDSNDEKRAIDCLNAAIGTTDLETRRIQHVPQYSFIAHMKAEQPGRPVLAKVADVDLPIAFCARGVWLILNNRKEFEKFYESQNIKLKWSWIESKESKQSKQYMKQFKS